MTDPESECTAHRLRISGKSVVATKSQTPHIWSVVSPWRLSPMHVRTRERAPSAPTRYLVRTEPCFVLPSLWSYSYLTRIGNSASDSSTTYSRNRCDLLIVSSGAYLWRFSCSIRSMRPWWIVTSKGKRAGTFTSGTNSVRTIPFLASLQFSCGLAGRGFQKATSSIWQPSSIISAAIPRDWRTSKVRGCKPSACPAFNVPGLASKQSSEDPVMPYRASSKVKKRPLGPAFQQICKQLPLWWHFLPYLHLWQQLHVYPLHSPIIVVWVKVSAGVAHGKEESLSLLQHSLSLGTPACCSVQRLQMLNRVIIRIYDATKLHFGALRTSHPKTPEQRPSHNMPVAPDLPLHPTSGADVCCDPRGCVLPVSWWVMTASQAFRTDPTSLCRD